MEMISQRPRPEFFEREGCWSATNPSLARSRRHWLVFALQAASAFLALLSFAAEPTGTLQLIAPIQIEARLELGKDLYLRNCLICHQSNGQGVPGAFPPLARSDFLKENLERSIKAVVEGLSGEIAVLGKKYNGSMPPVAIKDEDVADVFTYILNNWGNAGSALSAAVIKDVRSRSAYRTFESLQQATCYPPLPRPPEGFTLREVARL